MAEFVTPPPLEQPRETEPDPAGSGPAATTPSRIASGAAVSRASTSGFSPIGTSPTRTTSRTTHPSDARPIGSASARRFRASSSGTTPTHRSSSTSISDTRGRRPRSRSAGASKSIRRAKRSAVRINASAQVGSVESAIGATDRQCTPDCRRRERFGTRKASENRGTKHDFGSSVRSACNQCQLVLSWPPFSPSRAACLSASPSSLFTVSSGTDVGRFSSSIAT